MDEQGHTVMSQESYGSSEKGHSLMQPKSYTSSDKRHSMMHQENYANNEKGYTSIKKEHLLMRQESYGSNDKVHSMMRNESFSSSEKGHSLLRQESYGSSVSEKVGDEMRQESYGSTSIEKGHSLMQQESYASGDKIHSMIRNESFTSSEKGHSLMRQESYGSSVSEKVGDEMNTDCTMPGKFVCPSCSMVFSTREAMAEHMKALHDFKGPDLLVHECPECKTMFNCTFDLTAHFCNTNSMMLQKRKFALLTQGFDCQVCGKTVGTKGNLAKHMLLHNGLKPYDCALCGKSFSIKGNRDKHLLTHSEERPHECHICNKKFTLKGNLQQHILTHMDCKLFKCTICEKAFTLKGNLLKHMKRHETGARMKRLFGNGASMELEEGEVTQLSKSESTDEQKNDNEHRELISSIIDNLHETSKLDLGVNSHEDKVSNRTESDGQDEEQGEKLAIKLPQMNEAHVSGERNLYENAKVAPHIRFPENNLIKSQFQKPSNYHDVARPSIGEHFSQPSKPSFINPIHHIDRFPQHHEVNKTTAVHHLYNQHKFGILNNLHHDNRKFGLMNNFRDMTLPSVLSTGSEMGAFGHENLERLSNEAVRLKDQYERQRSIGDVRPGTASYSSHIVEHNQCK